MTEKETSLDIAIDENKLTINGVAVDIPVHISVLKKLLGKPRRVVYPKDSKSKDPLYLRAVNYTWDNHGVYCLTKTSRL